VKDVTAYLILEDGTVFQGRSAGAQREVISEVVFNTSMTGYLEVLTDPSYAGQAVVMTYPLIGNYGICFEDMESDRPWPDALIVRELSRTASNFRCEDTITNFLTRYNVPALTGIDTRTLTRYLRDRGTMNALITTHAYTEDEIREKLPEIRAYRTGDVVSRVTCKEKYTFEARPTAIPWPNLTAARAGTPDEHADSTALHSSAAAAAAAAAAAEAEENGTISADDPALAGTAVAEKAQAERREREDAQRKQRARERSHFRVAVLDLGAKRNILRSLAHRGCEVTVYPAGTKAEEILAAGHDGIMLSNGPGDPKDCGAIITEVRKLADSGTPIFAICLGHQLMALAMGGDTYKLKYGHRGGNHPVRDEQTGRVYITSQNHGYAVDAESVKGADTEPAFTNVNDGTNEGLRYRGREIFTVQFHPEACPGPQDCGYLFDRFLKMMEDHAHA